MRGRPLAIDLFCGCFGWSAGWLELGGYVVGFDLEHWPHHGPVPRGADLVIQDVLTIHGSQFRDAALILASPPCQAFSYMAMPWTRAKERARQYREHPETQVELTALFDACFRIQREASVAAGRHIPMVVENVRGAQPWVGRSAWSFGSFHLWGDVPALMPTTMPRPKVGGIKLSEVGFNVQACRNLKAENQRADGVKQGGDWFTPGCGSFSRHTGSKSSARKAASARIAKIPEQLARHIGRVYYPTSEAVA